jgi:hypothetical protein
MVIDGWSDYDYAKDTEMRCSVCGTILDMSTNVFITHALHTAIQAFLHL